MGHGGGRGKRNFRFHPCVGEATKGFKLEISKIAADTFNMGQYKFAAQFYIVNYLQCTSAHKGYLVAEAVRTGREQIIELPPAIDPSAANVNDQKIIRAEEVKMIAKRRLKLVDSENAISIFTG